MLIRIYSLYTYIHTHTHTHTYIYIYLTCISEHMQKHSMLIQILGGPLVLFLSRCYLPGSLQPLNVIIVFLTVMCPRDTLGVHVTFCVCMYIDCMLTVFHM